MKKIGRSEKISFPDLGVQSLSCKIDTGAFGTSLHVDGLFVKDDKLIFWIGNKKNRHIFTKFKVIKVKSSFGRVQERYTIRTRMVLGNRTYKIFVSLTDRKNMRFPCLVGRRFLHKFGYIVDVRKKNIYDKS
jgi:hypothetical protein